jgi:hypothetical protein
MEQLEFHSVGKQDRVPEASTQTATFSKFKDLVNFQKIVPFFVANLQVSKASNSSIIHLQPRIHTWFSFIITIILLLYFL